MIKKEGWLKKTNSNSKFSQKRYFVLNNSDLSWSKQPLGKIKGTLDLRNYSIINNNSSIKSDSSEDFSFKIQPLDNIDTNSKTYTLYAKNQQEMKEWVEALKRGKNTKILENHQNITNNNNFMKNSNDKQFETKPKGGWLEKKGKKRWFILRDNILYWFSREQSPNLDLKELQANGYLDLRLNCKITLYPSKPFTFIIIATVSNTAYILTAKNEIEMKDWIDAIENAIKNAIQQKLFSDLDIIKKGWLVKKGQKRLFILKKNQLLWYLSEKDSIEGHSKGSIYLSGCDVMGNQHITNKNTFLISTPIGIKYELLTNSEEELREWISSIKKEIRNSPKKVHEVNSNQNKKIKLQGWLFKEGKKRYFILTSDVLMWFSDDVTSEKNSSSFPSLPLNQHVNAMRSSLFGGIMDSTLPKGSLLLFGCTVTSHDSNDYSFMIYSSKIKPIIIKTKSVQEKNRWIEAIRESIATTSLNCEHLLESSNNKIVKKTGWLMKKGKPRWFLVVNEILMWFDTEQSEDLSRLAKGNISLAGCNVSSAGNLIGENNTIILSSETGRTYKLSAKTVEEAEEWISFLKQCIIKANETKKKISSNKDSLKEIKSGWMIKKGKKRFFILKNNFLMWYKSEQDQIELNGTVKGTITLAGCSLSVSNDTNTIILQTSMGSIYKLSLISGDDLNGWVNSLKKCIEEARQESARHYQIAEKNQKDLLEIILSSDFIIPITLMQVYQSDEVISSVIDLFFMHNEHIRLLNHIIYLELTSSGGDQKEATLFRSDSLATKSVRAFFKLVGQEYLQKTIGPGVNIIARCPTKSFEIDPLKASEEDNIEENKEQLKSLCYIFFENIIQSKNYFPKQMNIFLYHLKNMVSKYFPSSRYICLSAFVFLRFLCPAIFSPEGFNILDTDVILNDSNRRTLILAAKIIQSLANGILFPKEDFLLEFNIFIVENKDKIIEFLDSISNLEKDDSFIPVINQKKLINHLSTIVKYLDLTLTKIENKENSIENSDKNKNRVIHIKKLKKILADI